MVSLDLTITAEIAGVERALLAVENALSTASLEAFFTDQVNPYITKRAADRFANEGDDVVGKWAALRPATVAIRESEGFPGEHPINHRTGALERYITQSPGRIGTDGSGVELSTPGDTADGSMGMKLAIAQKGGISSLGGTVQSRPVIGLGKEDDTVITEMLRVHIESSLLGGVL